MTGARPGPVVRSADGVRLSTELVGPVDAPRVVLQHGVGSSRRFLLDAVAPPLVDAGWCVVAADLRGHGGSDPAGDPAAHVLDRQVADVAALVGRLGAAACGGVSLGGHAAVAAVARGRVPAGTRVVAALPAWTGRAVPGEGPHAAVASEVRAVGVDGMRARLAGEEGLLPWLRTVLLRDLAVHDDASLEASLVSLDGGLAPTAAELSSLTTVLGVVGWPGDPGHPLAVAEAWAAYAPASRLRSLQLHDPDHDPVALGRAVAAALGPP